MWRSSASAPDSQARGDVVTGERSNNDGDMVVFGAFAATAAAADFTAMSGGGAGDGGNGGGDGS